MGNRDIVAIGTSAGGVEALLYLAKHFPANFPASVLVTIHLPSHVRSSLDDVLSRAGPLPAAFAQNGMPIRKASIYIAPPGSHLLVDGDCLLLGVGPRENNTRPAIDPMLRSVALCCAGRAIGVVLTGTLGDGASGLWAISQCGGISVVQDPNDAAFPEMPMNALNRAKPDHVVHLADMPTLLTSLVHQAAGEPRPASDRLRFEVEIAKNGRAGMDHLDHLGRRSVLACPDCGGVMWELEEAGAVRYRCHVGHAYSGELMSIALDESLRRALGSAMRALDERAALVQQLYEQAAATGRAGLAESWARRAKEYRREADVIGEAIARIERLTDQSEPSAQSAAE